MTNTWRPIAALTYCLICLLDFCLIPALQLYLQYLSNQPFTQYEPLTLREFSSFHIVYGTFLGAYTVARTREKLSQNK